MSEKTIIITGGAGFIGSNLVRHVFEHSDYQIVVVDKLTYAGNIANIEDLLETDRVRLETIDIADAAEMNRVFSEADPDYLINMAAETHVDRSIHGPAEFVETNVVGTFVLLEAAQLFLYSSSPASDST